MAKTKVQEWDGTASNNTDINSVNIAENCSPAGINDAIREVMAQTATALSGSDDKIITGTPGTTGQLGSWNADGDLVAASGINSLAIGGTTPAAGAFTTLSASGTLTASGSFVFDSVTHTGTTGADVTLVSGTAGTDGNLVQWNTDGDVVDGPDLETTITDTDSAVPTSGAVVDYVGGLTSYVSSQATTSGSAVDFVIPSGAKRVTVAFRGVSTDGTSPLLVQLGDSGGIETTGYEGGSMHSAGDASSASGWTVIRTLTGDAVYAQMTLTLVDTANFGWAQSHGGERNGSSAIAGGGYKELTAELTTVRVGSNGDTFDAGSVIVMVET